MKRGSAFLILAWLNAAGAEAENLQDNAAERVAALSRGLESADLRTVYRSVSRIAELGEPALPELEVRAKVLQGRFRDYLELAADEIRAARHLSGLPPVRHVTMKSTDRNVVELLSELRTKTGALISLDNLMDEEKLPEVAIEVQDSTMLEAFDAICRAGNVSIAMDNGQFMLYPGQYIEVPRFFYGHYFVRLQEFERVKSVDFRKPATQDFKISMELLWDPSAAPSRVRPPRLLEAIDEKGKNLIPPPPPVRPKEETDPAPENEDAGILLMMPPSPGAEKISVLRGFVPIEVPRTLETAEFGTPTHEVTKKVGRFTFKILKMDEDPYRVEGEVTPLADLKAIGNLTVLANVVLKGGDQTRVVVAPTWNPESLGLVVTFQPLRVKEVLVKPSEDQAAAPVIEKLEISIVTSVQERRIPFEFRDVKIK